MKDWTGFLFGLGLLGINLSAIALPVPASIAQEASYITEEVLQDAALQIDRTLPKQLDEDLRWESLTAGPGVQITFDFTTPSSRFVALNDEEREIFAESFREEMIEMTCQQSDVSELLAAGVRFNIRLKTDSDRMLANFSYDASHCR
jgi:hypothetical protein